MNQRHQNGAAAEHIAAAFFLEKGWEVWWPDSQHSSADFSVSKGPGHPVKRVQVKKAFWSKGPQGYARNNEYLRITFATNTLGPRKPKYKKGDFDILMAVDDLHRLWRIPTKWVWERKSLVLDKRGPTVGTRSQWRVARAGYKGSRWIVHDPTNSNRRMR